MSREDLYGEAGESVSEYDLMEVVMVRLDMQTESSVELLDYLTGIFTNNKEKIMRRTGPLSDDIVKEVNAMTGVGAYLFEMARTEGLKTGLEQGRKRGLEQGLEQGRTKERIGQIERLLRKGKTPEDIAEFNDYPIEFVKEVQENLLAETSL